MLQLLLFSLALPVLAVAVPLAPAHSAQPERLDALVAASFDPTGPGGVVIVRREGETLLHRAYGMANLELGVPMETAHRLAAGSITKPMTAAGILLLVQAGKLALDDDVRAFLPSVSPGEQRMTIEQLLTHTSGFPSAVDRQDFDAISRQQLSPEALLSLTDGMAMHFTAGTAYRYSDSGYFLLGAVIEAVSGLEYAEFMRRHLFQPSGLMNTVYWDGQQIIAHRASGYSKDDRGFITAPYIDMSIPYSAGGIYTTAADLADWIDALRAGRFIERQLLERAWTSPRLADGTLTGYGYGWNICEISGQRALGHGGFINGFTAALEYLPDAEITIAVLTNQDAGEPDATYLARRIARLLITGRAGLQPAELDQAQRAAVTGTYHYANGERRRIFEQAAELWSQRNDGDPVRLVPLSADYLAFPDSEGTYGLEFVRDAAGGVASVITRLNCTLLEVAKPI